MAEKKSEGGDAAPAKKKTKLLLFLVIGMLAIVLAGAGAAFILIKQKNQAVDEEGDEPAPTHKTSRTRRENADAPPVFVKLEPFTVKLQVEQQEAYLQATPELRVFDQLVGDRIKQYMPEIRHKVLLLMSGKKATELSSPQGVQRMSNEIRDNVNLIIDGPKSKPKGKGKQKEEVAPVVPGEPADEADPDDSVQAVLFTSFIIQ